MKTLKMTPERIKQKEVITKAFGDNWGYCTISEFNWWYKKAKQKLAI